MRRNWVKWSCYAAPELSGAFRQRPLENVASRAETRVLCPTGKLRCILEASTGLRANSVHQREFSLTGKLRCGQKTSTGWKSHHQRGKWCAGKLWCRPQKKHHLRWARCQEHEQRKCSLKKSDGTREVSLEKRLPNSRQWSNSNGEFLQRHRKIYDDPIEVFGEYKLCTILMTSFKCLGYIYPPSIHLEGVGA